MPRHLDLPRNARRLHDAERRTTDGKPAFKSSPHLAYWMPSVCDDSFSQSRRVLSCRDFLFERGGRRKHRHFHDTECRYPIEAFQLPHFHYEYCMMSCNPGRRPVKRTSSFPRYQFAGASRNLEPPGPIERTADIEHNSKHGVPHGLYFNSTCVSQWIGAERAFSLGSPPNRPVRSTSDRLLRAKATKRFHLRGTLDDEVPKSASSCCSLATDVALQRVCSPSLRQNRIWMLSVVAGLTRSLLRNPNCAGKNSLSPAGSSSRAWNRTRANGTQTITPEIVDEPQTCYCG